MDPVRIFILDMLCFLDAVGKRGFITRAKENKASFPVHQVTKINYMRAVILFFGKCVEINIVENSQFHFSGSKYG